MSEQWERLDEKTGLVVGVDRNGDRTKRKPSQHEQQYMPRWGKNQNTDASRQNGGTGNE